MLQGSYISYTEKQRLNWHHTAPVIIIQLVTFKVSLRLKLTGIQTTDFHFTFRPPASTL